MCDQNISKDKILEKAEKVIGLLLVQANVDHNQKEKMAHGAFLVMLAISGAVISSEKWPPNWVPDIFISSKTIAVLGLTIVWLSIHVFIRFQLRLMRHSAILYGGVLRALINWITHPPSLEELKVFDPSEKKMKIKNKKLINALDLVIPIPSGKVEPDVELEGFPIAIVQELKCQFEKGTGALFSEYILSYGSFFIFVCVLARTYFG